MGPLLLKQEQGHSAQKPFWFASVVDVHAFEILPCCGDSLDHQRPLLLLASQKSCCLCSLLSWLGHPKRGGVKSFEEVDCVRGEDGELISSTSEPGDALC